MRKIIPILIILLTIISELFACDCTEITVQEGIKNADVVVVGTIISKKEVTLTPDPSFVKDKTKFYLKTLSIFQYTLSVESIYKGDITTKTITIFSFESFGGSTCGYDFVVGKKYIIYGNKESNKRFMYENFSFPKGENIFWTHLCTRTKLFKQEEITEIEKYAEKQR